MTQRESEIIELIHKEVKPALGCTEPIAVALAVTKAVELIRNNCCKGCLRYNGDQWRLDTNFRIMVYVSGNILKNGMGVGIPGTGMVGLHIAAALGAVCGKTEYGLEVLHDLDYMSIERAKQLVSEGYVTVALAETDAKLYVKAVVEASSHDNFCPDLQLRGSKDGNCHIANAVIEGDHDRFVETALDDNILFSSQAGGQGTMNEKSTLDYGLTVKEIWDFANTVSFDDISFILDSRTLNKALAKEGLEGNYGLKVGKTIFDKKFKPVFGEDFLGYAMAQTAAASDARMAGCTLPAMSNSGSGNQGITVTMPVISYSEKYDVSDERLARALVLSHLVAIHIKGYLGKLSALCGCVIASTGSSCGLVYLEGGGYDEVCSAIKNMIGNITGMVCDGAKVGCALKVASGVSSSVQSAVLALSGTCISDNDGIIEKDIEKTIQNLGKIGSVGMQSTDHLILDIMSCK
ncbi:MAG: L-serine ammonia-lyase, iron-sulfur-dependent, subunit alpha [Bacteroidales bacterium]|nr:L-serine ammonia-lyase, iron-sulfur-dependent, subunit alpha [Bacteroidales bacterium]